MIQLPAPLLPRHRAALVQLSLHWPPLTSLKFQPVSPGASATQSPLASIKLWSSITVVPSVMSVTSGVLPLGTAYPTAEGQLNLAISKPKNRVAN